MRIPESELIINSDGSAFHIHIKPEQLADRVIVVGDPGRVDQIAVFLDSIECRNASREFVSVTGSYKGKRFTVLSTGIGTDNIDIVMTELDALANIDFSTREVKPEHRKLTILRIGTCGALQPDVPIGSYVFSRVSIGFDGLMNWYADRESLDDFEAAFKAHMNWNPHLPDPYFVRASERIAQAFEGSTIQGMTISAPGFYGPQGRVVRLPLAMPDMLDRISAFRFGGMKINNFEMESSALAGLAAKLGHDAGTVCCAIANRQLKDSNPNYKRKIEGLVQLCLDTLAEKL
ncbi:MAG: nucleoside phosphorylase [Bacteroidales bacterium]|nr:nucleoside phosphorylase [Bacteroidales bacterium]